MLSRATPTRIAACTFESAGARRLDRDARRIAAVIHASSKLQRLRNRIAALELALARIEQEPDAP